MNEETRAELLADEWKQLAAYIEQSFHSLENYSLQAVAVVGAAAGILAAAEPEKSNVIWPFVAPIILVLLFRLQAQITFSYFQARRLLEIERSLGTLSGNGPKLFYYAHRVRCWAACLRRTGGYAYVWWLGSLHVGGVAFIFIATIKSCQVIALAYGWWSLYIPLYVVTISVFVGGWLECVASLQREVTRNLVSTDAQKVALFGSLRKLFRRAKDEHSQEDPPEARLDSVDREHPATRGQ